MAVCFFQFVWAVSECIEYGGFKRRGAESVATFQFISQSAASSCTSDGARITAAREAECAMRYPRSVSTRHSTPETTIERGSRRVI